MAASKVLISSIQGGETIPKEYHRRVLKKIAQLTKVVYSLHTKNDDNEERIETLIAEHDKEKRRWESELDSRIKEQNHELSRSDELEGKIASLQNERDQLIQEHNISVEEAEKRLQSVIEDESHKLVKMKMEANLWKEKLNVRDKEYADLKKQLTDTIEISTHKQASLEERLDGLEKQAKDDSESYKHSFQMLKNNHEEEMNRLILKHEEAMESLRCSLSDERETATRLEAETFELKYKTFEARSAEKEASLNNRLSNISTELAKTKDELAVSQQRERDLEMLIYDRVKQNESDTALLQQEKDLVNQLKANIDNLTQEIIQLQDTSSSQHTEINNMAGLIGELEAMKMHLQKERDRLVDELDEQTRRLISLEEERKTVSKEYDSESKQILLRVHTLEEEVEQLLQEKKDLRTQFAREIEAAQSALSEATNESHAKQIQELLQRQQFETNELKSEHEVALESLRKDCESRIINLEAISSERYSKDTRNLSQQLTDQENEVAKLKNDLQNTKLAVKDKERELVVAKDSIRSREIEVESIRQQLAEKSLVERDLLDRLQSLQTTYDSLKRDSEQTIQTHSREILEVKEKSRSQTEEEMKKKAKADMSRLRDELEAQYKQSKKSALSKMVELKDSTFKECEEKWNKERRILMDQIEQLQKDIENVKQSSKMSLMDISERCNQQLEDLRIKCTQKVNDVVKTKEELVCTHSKEMQTIKSTLEQKNKENIDKVTKSHQKELLEAHRGSTIALESLKMELERQNHEALEELRRAHALEISDIQQDMNDSFTIEMNEVKSKFSKEQENIQKQAQTEINTLNSEISKHMGVVSTLGNEVADYRNEVSRMKDRLDLLNTELNDKRKQLEMNERELQLFQQEAMTQLKVREDQLTSSHASEMESLICQHKHQTQIMLNEFNKAKEILIKKLQSTERKFQIADSKYRNRGSLPEDIAAIDQLNNAIKEQDRKIRDLVMEKRVYEMELMNREKNYNKLFKAVPQVGVLDPLKGRRKPRSPQLFPTMGHSSSPSLISMDNSLPSITSINSQDYRDIPLSPRRGSHPSCHQSQPSLLNTPEEPSNDHAPHKASRVTSPQIHKPVITKIPSSPSLMSKRPIKFLTNDDSLNSTTDRTKGSTNLQSTSLPANSIVA